MKRYLIIGALLVSAITSHANIGDSRAESAKRYGQPTSHYGNRDVYPSNARWMIIQWFNPDGYAEVVSYYRHDGTISQGEIQKFLNVNVRSTKWYQIQAKGDARDAVAQIWLTVDNAFRYESGACRIGNAWFSYLELSTYNGHIQLTEENQHLEQNQTASTDSYLPL